MENRKEKNAPWLSVPQFGDWDQKGEVPDYSLNFSKIREKRKQNKWDVSRVSLGNEGDFVKPIAPSNTNTTHRHSHSRDDQHHHFHQSHHHHSPTTKRNILSYFNCCVKA